MENIESFYRELKKELKKKRITKAELSKLKVVLCRKHKLKRIPTDIEILLSIDDRVIDSKLAKQLQTKPSRTGSGVAVVAIMTRPFECPHAKKGAGKGSGKGVGPCSYCPGGVNSVFGSVPQSYTGKEPATMRGIRNKYDAYLQVFNRLEQYVCLGHDFEKMELIIMGGTFPSYPDDYRKEFVTDALKAMNDFSDYFFRKNVLQVKKFREFFEMPGDVHDENRVKRIHKKILALKNQGLSKSHPPTPNHRSIKDALTAEQKRNETAIVRCVGMTIESRPDYAMLSHANEMLELGCTRVELGVQSLYDDVLDGIRRGHGVKESIESTRILKDLGFKINYHMMPGLPGSSLEKDEQMFINLFRNPDFKPDMLKIYPCMVVQGTRLYDEWKKGRYVPLTTTQAAELIMKIKQNVPDYVRIMRVQRDIPSTAIAAGVDKTNLRQYIDALLREKNLKCRCIRCREPRANELNGKEIGGKLDIKIKTQLYEASGGVEFFISAEDEKKDLLFGFCRMRFPSQQLRKEITKDSALIRELHVYGIQENIGAKGKAGSVQHKGLGKKLLKTAEQIAKKNGKNKIVVISGIGAREYYKKLGYRREGVYMVKKI